MIVFANYNGGVVYDVDHKYRLMWSDAWGAMEFAQATRAIYSRLLDGDLDGVSRGVLLDGIKADDLWEAVYDYAQNDGRLDHGVGHKAGQEIPMGRWLNQAMTKQLAEVRWVEVPHVNGV